MPSILAGMCLIFAILGLVYEKNLYNPVTAFFGLWSVIIHAAGLCLYGMYPASTNTYIIILIGIIGFLLGCIWVYFPRKYSSNWKDSNSTNINNRRTYQLTDSIIEEELEINYVLVYILLIMSLLYLVPNTIQIINLMRQGHTLKQIRFSFWNIDTSDLYNLRFEHSYRVYVFQTIMNIIPAIAVIDLLAGKRDKKLLIGCIVISILNVMVSGGGRLHIMYLACDLVLVFLICRNRIFISSKLKKVILVFTGMLIVAFVYVTIARDITSVLKSFYVYLAGCVPHMDIRLEPIIAERDLTYGIASLKGLTQPFLLALRLTGIFGIDQYPQIFLNASEFMDLRSIVYIGDGIRYNGFVSLFYYFFLDGRYIGVAVGSFIYGALGMWLYMNVKTKFSLRNLLVYAIYFRTLVISMTRLQFVQVHYTMAFILAFFIFKKKVYKTQKNENGDKICLEESNG